MVAPDGVTYLLVHSPLVGPATLRPLGAALERHGEAAVGPDLRAALDAGPPYHDRLARFAAAAVDGGTGPVVLVGHSGAGAVLPAVADRVGADRVATAVFVDAVLPSPGRRWTAGAPGELLAQLRGLVGEDGRLPPWDAWFPPGTLEALVPDAGTLAGVRDELPRVPYAYFEEDAPDLPPPARCAYLRLSEMYDDAARTAGARGWPVAGADRHHLATVTDPDEIAAAVRALVATAATG